MAGIRAFEAADIQQVANLHQKVFGVVKTPDISSRYTAYFTDKFLDPVRRGALPSLVFEDDDGEISGFIGIATRWFMIGSRRIRAAVSTQFIAEPRARYRLIGVALLRDFLKGPQDFSFTDEANETSRILWERLGGSTSVLHSLHWIAPLRPTNLLLSRSQSRFGSLMTLAGPVANLFDGIASVLTRRGKLRPQPDLRIEPLHAHALANFMSKPVGDMMLHPENDAAIPRPDAGGCGQAERSGCPSSSVAPERPAGRRMVSVLSQSPGYRRSLAGRVSEGAPGRSY